MIAQPSYQGIVAPLYGQPVPRDGIVQALMNGIGSGPQANASSALAGLGGGMNPASLAALAKQLMTPNQTPGYTPADVGGVGNLAVMQGAGAAGT